MTRGAEPGGSYITDQKYVFTWYSENSKTPASYSMSTNHFDCGWSLLSHGVAEPYRTLAGALFC